MPGSVPPLHRTINAPGGQVVGHRPTLQGLAFARTLPLWPMFDDRLIFIQDTSGEGVDQWKMLCPELRALSDINGDRSKGLAVLDGARPVLHDS